MSANLELTIQQLVLIIRASVLNAVLEAIVLDLEKKLLRKLVQMDSSVLQAQ